MESTIIINYNLIIYQILIFRRPLDADDDEIVAGTLWSDPVSKPGVTDSSRGIGFFFGPDVTKQFLGKLILNDTKGSSLIHKPSISQYL